MISPVCAMSATAIATAIRQRALSCREVIEAHLTRIAQINTRVNALTVVFSDQALSQADAADRALAQGKSIGPLHGVPITVKENIDVAGSATTKGVPVLKDAIAGRDAPVITHLKAAGAIVIARSNMPEFGMRWHTDNELHGATLNPWHVQRTPGGSSGGEAAAIATGMSPLGIGNDMGGSTRQPAINCGICGLRPGTGRVSRVMTTNADDIPMYYEQIACVNGPMARTVEDLQLALSVMQQPDPSDPIWQPAVPPPGCAQENRVGLITQLPGDATEPAVSRALQSAAGTLRTAGYQVEEIEAPDLQTADDIIQRLALFEVEDYLDDILPLLGTDARRFLTTVISKEDVDGASYRNAIAERHRVARHWNELLQQYPLIMGPVSTMEPFIVGADTGSAAGINRIVRSFRLTELCNLLGLPALALPVTLDNGVPQGVQLIARRFDEARCFAAAKYIQQDTQITTPIEPAN